MIQCISLYGAELDYFFEILKKVVGHIKGNENHTDIVDVECNAIRISYGIVSFVSKQCDTEKEEMYFESFIKRWFLNSDYAVLAFRIGVCEALIDENYIDLLIDLLDDKDTDRAVIKWCNIYAKYLQYQGSFTKSKGFSSIQAHKSIIYDISFNENEDDKLNDSFCKIHQLDKTELIRIISEDVI